MLELCCAILTASVLIPRSRRNAANGSTVPPNSFEALLILSITSFAPDTVPAMMSVWPPRYFVALCITTSIPSLCGCWLIGVAKVLSIMLVVPTERVASATLAISTILSVGFVGVSKKQSLYLPPESESWSANSSWSTMSTLIPF